VKFSIATVSLGGALRDKLAAIAEAGFEGVEIFETDILAHDGPPAEVVFSPSVLPNSGKA
jgi:4-hydroxyphenylpyruvate dioxygenase